MTTYQILLFFGLRALVALLAGAIMGIERTITSHAAGIKTIVFVSLGSCLFTTLSFYLKIEFPTSDPTRMIGQIITGVGFLGAGAIFHSGERISGLTSAAMIWVACALGTMAGANLLWIPIFASIAFVIIMILLKHFEKFLSKYEKVSKKLDE